ncbi:MAG: hypothetical protein IPL49_18780 [Saprospirales bacterium]|nr:hypothetical protein [Saprospirales bacterium]
MKNFKFLLLLLLPFVAVVSFTACGDDPIVEPPVDKSTLYEASSFNLICADSTHATAKIVTVTHRGEGTGTITWTKDNAYVLNGLVFVNEGQTLTIEAGTIIKGKSGQGENAAALIVARGARIIAEGTAADPIIFTSEADPVFRKPDGSYCSGGGLSASTRGLWGGLIVLGKAGLNSTPGETAIEGIPTTEPRGLYGGSDDADNSGSLKYISIRHGGTDIGAGNEINGLSLGGVGSGTTIDYVEVFANADDGFEYFGGTVQTKHLVSAFCGDDGMDYDEGWRGKGQFWFVFQDNDADRGGEHDGGTNPEDGMPYATPVIYNASYRGSGSANGKRAVTFRDNAGGEYHNSIFWSYGRGVDIEYLEGQCSYNQWGDGSLKFEHNVLYDIAGSEFVIRAESGTLPATAQTDADAYFADKGNKIATDAPVDSNYGPINDAVSGPFSTTTDAFFTNTTYKGAFAPGVDRWTKGWARLEDEL